MKINRLLPLVRSGLVGIATTFLLLGCTDDDDDSDFVVHSTAQGTAPSSPVVVRGRWIAYLADEFSTAGGTDFNQDGDTVDSVAALIDLATLDERTLDVAARELAVVGDEIYLVVDENDDLDRNGDLDTDDLLLMHWSDSIRQVQLVDELDRGGEVHAVEASGRLYYVASDDPLAGETSLRFLEPGAPFTPNPVPSGDPANPLDPRLLRADEDLLFLHLDEIEEMRDVNADGDTSDGFVLALLDATDPAAEVQNAALALADDDTPLRALARAPGDWLVAFLVDETAQGNTNLNDPDDFPAAWLPFHCNPAGSEADGDALDQVLHFLEFASWNVVNTGIAGADRIVAVGSFVGALSPEASGVAAGDPCDLNDDGDTTDRVARWIRADGASVPVADSTLIVALASTVIGGTSGLAEFDGRLAAAVSEVGEDEDIDGDGQTEDDLIGWLDPASPAGGWEFDHRNATSEVQFAGPTYLAETADRENILAALDEEVLGGTASDPNNGDSDFLDSLPGLGYFDSSTDVDFGGVRIAVDTGPAGAGIVLAFGSLLYRVDEAEDNRDWNKDGDESDQVLLRTRLSDVATDVLGTLNALTLPAVVTDDDRGAAFLADETIAEADLNGDGDANDFVLRWFRF